MAWVFLLDLWQVVGALHGSVSCREPEERGGCTVRVDGLGHMLLSDRLERPRTLERMQRDYRRVLVDNLFTSRVIVASLQSFLVLQKLPNFVWTRLVAVTLLQFVEPRLFCDLLLLVHESGLR